MASRDIASESVSIVTGATLLLAALRDLLIAWPVIGFVCMGVIGGVAGYAFAVEHGALDEADLRGHLGFLFRRVALGWCLAVAVWMVWEAYSPATPLLGMLAAGVAGAFPVQAFRFAQRMFLQGKRIR